MNRAWSNARTSSLAAALLGMVLASTAGCFDPLVGARCADGYVPCHGRCVATCSADGSANQGDGKTGRDDDGGRGDARPNGDAIADQDGVRRGDGGVIGLDASRADGTLADGQPVPDGGVSPLPDGARPVDAGITDASTSDSTTDAAVVDAAIIDADLTDASAIDAALTDASAIDAALTDAAVVDALVTDAPPPPDGAVPPDVLPPPDCGAQQVRCSGACTNLDNDPDNCGACGFGCGTGICLGGVCQQRQAGHLVVIGHDYAVSRTAMDNIVGNAVFIAPGSPVRVLAYQGAASSEAIGGTDTAIQSIANKTGRTWIKANVDALTALTGLPAADVFLIYAQSGATNPELVALGQLWSAAMTDFLQAGKTIILLEGWYANDGTFQIVRQANLFHANARFDATGQSVMVVRPGDAVTSRVPRIYRGERGTVWFDSSDQSVVVQVASDAGIEPVVLHLVF